MISHAMGPADEVRPVQGRSRRRGMEPGVACLWRERGADTPAG